MSLPGKRVPRFVSGVRYDGLNEVGRPHARVFPSRSWIGNAVVFEFFGREFLLVKGIPSASLWVARNQGLVGARS